MRNKSISAGTVYGIPTTFIRYGLTGMLNTLVHWLVFFIGYSLFHLNQASANAVAFTCAVTVSFFINARWTFSSPVSLKRYLLWASFMALFALFTGWCGDILALNPFLTLIIFSALSLVIGFFFANRFVFR